MIFVMSFIGSGNVVVFFVGAARSFAIDQNHAMKKYCLLSKFRLHRLTNAVSKT